MPDYPHMQKTLDRITHISADIAQVLAGLRSNNIERLSASTIAAARSECLCGAQPGAGGLDRGLSHGTRAKVVARGCDRHRAADSWRPPLSHRSGHLVRWSVSHGSLSALARPVRPVFNHWFTEFATAHR